MSDRKEITLTDEGVKAHSAREGETGAPKTSIIAGTLTSEVLGGRTLVVVDPEGDLEHPPEIPLGVVRRLSISPDRRDGQEGDRKRRDGRGEDG